MTRRMFSDEITTSDAFLDMGAGSQLLYFHLGMAADDDGFVANPKMIMRVLGAGEDDYKVLVAKKFVLVFDTGVCVIKAWRMNNYLRKDIYKPTKYIEEKKLLFIRPNGVYTFNPEGAIALPPGHFTLENIEENASGELRARAVHLGKDRIGKVREGKISKEDTDTSNKEKEDKKEKYGEFGKVRLTPEEHQKLVERMGQVNTDLMIAELDTGIESKGYRYKSHYATILNWARRKFQEHNRASQPKKRTIAAYTPKQ